MKKKFLLAMLVSTTICSSAMSGAAFAYESSNGAPACGSWNNVQLPGWKNSALIGMEAAEPALYSASDNYYAAEAALNDMLYEIGEREAKVAEIDASLEGADQALSDANAAAYEAERGLNGINGIISMIYQAIALDAEIRTYDDTIPTLEMAIADAIANGADESEIAAMQQDLDSQSQYVEGLKTLLGILLSQIPASSVDELYERLDALGEEQNSAQEAYNAANEYVNEVDSNIRNANADRATAAGPLIGLYAGLPGAQSALQAASDAYNAAQNGYSMWEDQCRQAEEAFCSADPAACGEDPGASVEEYYEELYE